MRYLLPLARDSAKIVFRNLRKQSPFYCTALKREVFVGKKFFQHISYRKDRHYKQIIERLLVIPFIDKILKEGKLIESRYREHITFYKVSYCHRDYSLSIIVQKDHFQTAPLTLLSCFKN